MSEPVVASTQYGDLKGTIAIDGWDGLTVMSMGAGGRRGYWTVGIEFYGEPDTKGSPLHISAYVYAVDESILEGRGPDAIRKYADQHGQLPVFRFSTEFTIEDLIPVIKRLSIVVQDRTAKRVPMVLVGGDEIHGDDDE